MNWDKGKSLLNKLQNLVVKLNRINEENEVLTGNISDEGDFDESKKSKSDYCNFPDAKNDSEGLASGRTG